MTKPQAIPFLLPFAAWFWATGGVREVLRAAAIGLVVIVVLWIPFISAGGPAYYVSSVGQYSSGVFSDPVAASLEPLVARPGDRRPR